MQIFEYAVIYVGKEKEEKSKIIVPITATVATSLDNAKTIAARAIPEEYIDKLDQCQVAVRPF